MLTFHLIYTLSSFRQSTPSFRFSQCFLRKITPKPDIHFNTSHSHGYKNNFYYLIQSVKQLRKCTFHNILCTISFFPMFCVYNRTFIQYIHSRKVFFFFLLLYRCIYTLQHAYNITQRKTLEILFPERKKEEKNLYSIRYSQ